MNFVVVSSVSIKRVDCKKCQNAEVIIPAINTSVLSGEGVGSAILYNEGNFCDFLFDLYCLIWVYTVCAGLSVRLLRVTRAAFRSVSYWRVFCPGPLFLMALVIRYKDPGQKNFALLNAAMGACET